jgi:hypothetical protein
MSLQHTVKAEQPVSSRPRVVKKGFLIGISEVVEGRKRMVREARQYVAALEEMLEAEKGGKLEDCRGDDALAAVPKLTMGDYVPKNQ